MHAHDLNRTDVILFTFLEEYLAKLENPLALQVWTRYLTLAKDVTANVKEFRSQVFPVLRYVFQYVLSNF